MTNDASILHYVQNILEYLIGGIGTSINCTKKGVFYFQCSNHDVINVINV